MNTRRRTALGLLGAIGIGSLLKGCGDDDSVVAGPKSDTDLDVSRQSLGEATNDRVTPEMFGAVGNNATVDGPALQAALNTGLTVCCRPGRVYLCNAAPGKTYALVMRDGFRLELNGATIRLAPQNPGVKLIVSKGVADGTTDQTARISIRNGTVDGNALAAASATSTPISWPPAATPTFNSTMDLSYLRESILDELTIINSWATALYVTTSPGDPTTVSRNRIGHLRVQTAYGSGIHLDGELWTIDSLVVENVNAFAGANTSGWEGNPVVLWLQRSTIGLICASDFSNGIKVQTGCADLSIGEIVAIGSSKPCQALVKLQGSATTPNKRIIIGSIACSNAQGNGLYVYYSSDVSIGSYVGDSNGQSGDQSDSGADVLVYDSQVQIANVDIRNARRVGLRYNETSESGGTSHLQIGRMSFVSSEAGHLFPIYAGYGRVTVNDMFVKRRSQTGGVALIYGTAQRSPLSGDSRSQDYVHVGRLVADLDIDFYYQNRYQLFHMAAPTHNLEIERFILTGCATTTLIQLDAGTSSKRVRNPAVNKHSTECGATLLVTPANANARALLGAGGCYYELADMAVETDPAPYRDRGGYTLFHPTVPATGTYLVRVTVLGYSAPFPA